MKELILSLSLAISYLTSYSQQSGTYKDLRDGKVYKTVKIGVQTWFAENFASEAGSGCWSYDNDSSNANKYGTLYNWETAKIFCPKGWHLPSDAEWTDLTNYLGGESMAGGKMKATTDWKSNESGNATNEYGFSALPAGYRGKHDGSFNDMGENAYFWSSTPDDSKNVWGRFLCYFGGGVNHNYHTPTNGFSVRCTKDDNSCPEARCQSSCVWSIICSYACPGMWIT